MTYYKDQISRAQNLIQGRNIFNEDKGNGIFRSRNRDYILQNGDNNLYKPCLDDIKSYFAVNHIGWWNGKKATCHPLSSQIACLNHLFPIRHDKNAVLAIIRQIESSVVDIMPVRSDIAPHGYVAFELVSDNDYLDEKTLRRGSNCTSIDALILGQQEDGSTILFPIEWKYVEKYGNKNKAIGREGNVRKGRYEKLIDESCQLVASNHMVYYFEPFYQLMRQTLWAEQMIRHRNRESIKADKFIHIHVIPEENTTLLHKKYPCSGKGMEATWRDCIHDQGMYRIISPKNLLAPVNYGQYRHLLDYLGKRYWNGQS